jgi:uncharacterized membrane protein
VTGLNKLYKDLILIIIMGTMYMGIEILWRDYTDISMMFVGGLCGFLVGRLNEHPKFYDRKMWQQCLIGTLITLCIEFISGMILNVWLKLNIWDYSKEFGNVYGQICLTYAGLWFILMPLAIWLDDWLRYRLFKEEMPTGLVSYYLDLFTNK